MLRLLAGSIIVLAGGVLLLIDRLRRRERLTLVATACIIAGFVILGTTTPTA